MNNLEDDWVICENEQTSSVAKVVSVKVEGSKGEITDSVKDDAVKRQGWMGYMASFVYSPDNAPNPPDIVVSHVSQQEQEQEADLRGTVEIHMPDVLSDISKCESLSSSDSTKVASNESGLISSAVSQNVTEAINTSDTSDINNHDDQEDDEERREAIAELDNILDQLSRLDDREKGERANWSSPQKNNDTNPPDTSHTNDTNDTIPVISWDTVVDSPEGIADTDLEDEPHQSPMRYFTSSWLAEVEEACRETVVEAREKEHEEEREKQVTQEKNAKVPSRTAMITHVPVIRRRHSMPEEEQRLRKRQRYLNDSCDNGDNTDAANNTDNNKASIEVQPVVMTDDAKNQVDDDNNGKIKRGRGIGDLTICELFQICCDDVNAVTAHFSSLLSDVTR